MKAPLAWVLVCLLAALGLLWGWRWFNGGSAGIQNQAVARREIAMRVLAEHLAESFPGKNVLVLSNPFSQLSGQPGYVYDFEKAGIQGLKRGWNDKMRLAGVVFPSLREGAAEAPEKFPIDPETKTPLSFLTSPGAWDALHRQYPEADLVVSLIGLPLDLKNLELWSAPRPHLALLLPDLRMIGDREQIRAAFKSGKLAALVLNRPGAPPESALLDPDYRKEFERYYLLVTAQNIDNTLSNWPQAF